MITHPCNLEVMIEYFQYLKLLYDKVGMKRVAKKAYEMCANS